jgi:hypothetical protein
MRLSGFGWVHNMKSPIRLCLCLVLICLTTTGATVYAAGKPDIKLFKADPLVLNEGESASYTFVVKNATEVWLVEAGNILKKISNPSAATLKGTAQGLTTYAIRTGNSNTFTAVLIAKNDSGEATEEITLSFATEPPSEQASLIPPVSATLANPARSPQWLPPLPTSPPSTQPPSTTTHVPPEFAECPSDCRYCLTPDETASHGATKKCLEQPCYYSPDNMKYWYCYSEPEGWCCADGKVFQSGEAQCVQVGGYWYTTQAEAERVCQEMMTCWCCADGKVGQIPQIECLQMGGNCYDTQTQAERVCQEMMTCWCCADGKVGQIPQIQCLQIGGNCYDTQTQAVQACQEAATCWCCADGKVGQIPQIQCLQIGGNCYATQTQAVQACQEAATCWCCANGQVFQAPQTQCMQMGGNCYATQTQAVQACQQAATCWCCANGQVFQAPQTQCMQMGGNCYATQTQAVQACQRAATCWCCAGGKVFQTTQTQCMQMGGACYGSQDQAARACQQEIYIPPPTLKR